MKIGDRVRCKLPGYEKWFGTLTNKKLMFEIKLDKPIISFGRKKTLGYFYRSQLELMEKKKPKISYWK